MRFSSSFTSLNNKPGTFEAAKDCTSRNEDGNVFHIKCLRKSKVTKFSCRKQPLEVVVMTPGQDEHQGTKSRNFWEPKPAI